MNINTDYTIRLGNRNIVKIMKGSTTIWEKSTTPIITPDYFYIENTYNGSNTITLTTTKHNNPSFNDYSASVQYSKDKENWTTLTFSSSKPKTISMSNGEKVYFRNDNGKFNHTDGNNWYYTTFTATNSHIVGGNIVSLLKYTNMETFTLTKQGCLERLFQGDESLTDSYKLIFPNTTSSYCYSSMFYNCRNMRTSPLILPSTTLSDWCYSLMFQNCNNLTTTPDIYATTLADYCYYGMFTRCTSLTTAPELPVTTLADSCYNSMFDGCTSLTTGPILSATTLVTGCYQGMFYNCTSLKEVTTYANDISAEFCLTDWLKNVAAKGTFYNNGSASYVKNSASGIPTGWTEVKPYTGPDYFYIDNVDSNSGNVSFTFKGTPSSSTIQQIEWSKDKTNWTPVTLVANTTTNVPVNAGEKVYFRNDSGKFSSAYNIYFTFGGDVLHDVGGDLYTLLDYTNENVSLSNYAFTYMFENDTRLVNASDLVLRWSTLATQCYGFMFYNCTSLTTTPSLPATTLATQCYKGMFYGCTSLITAPTLPATTLSSGCYETMFNGCTSLNSVTTYAEKISAFNCLSSWLSGVASVGTLHNLGDATYKKNSSSGIPTGWYEDNPFYIKNVDSQSGNVSFTFNGTPSSSTIQQIEWSKDRNNWTSVTLTANTTTNVPVSVGEKVYFRNDSGKCSQRSSAYLKFGSDKNINIGGNIYTLLDYTNENVSLPQYAFANLFSGNNKLLDASKLSLHWTTLSDSCYLQMFSGCSSLTTAPSLPATTLANNCYNNMFQGCSSLTNAPSLPATTLVSNCYSAMFANCSSLTTVPSLPATTLAIACYAAMFIGCPSLTTAPTLPATTLVDNCYRNMFKSCSSLNSVTTYADDISASNCLTDWLNSVAATGTFYNNGSATYTIDSVSGIPVGWIEIKPSTGEKYFYIENVDSDSGNVIFIFKGTPSSSTIQQIEWSKDKEYWTTVSLGQNRPNNVDIFPGERVYFRNNSGYCSNGQSNYLNFTSNVEHKVGGNLYTLLNHLDENEPLQRYLFYGLFKNDTKLIDASDLVLGWTTLVNYCYRSMFQDCTSLTTAPSLPATTLAPQCYRDMFSGCTSLNEVTTYANNISASGCLTNWLSGVASSGTFHNRGTATYPSGASGIPRGWTEVRS